ncbi:radical SAM protein [Dethiobacter alkaliphilus]|uniref:Radical SAM domain protein n=1 Tax=Dethiobacter alkaliphilus AHT 1 TaxID=555088 RepID=C0GDV6_DETAL|nr:radical SAM protein [Dethiobacter alkaliphilus]EEG78250.1 Radical SAM domain protein [Dethiobacter alkaliphilus AHT 1]
MRYTELATSGELTSRAEKAVQGLGKCLLCPQACGVDRTAGKTGFCRAGKLARVSSYGPHFGEEAPLVGRGGSGTIFFAYCNLRCVFCQNYDISHMGYGDDLEHQDLAEVMLALQKRGCENINFVTPTHYVPQILSALSLAAKKGLTVPLVYNCGAYECPETLKLLDGVIDIYLPDTKFSDPGLAKKYSGVENYPASMFSSLKEMHRQVGTLQVDKRGVAVRGLMVRHLIMPGGLAGTEDVLRFIAAELSPDTYINLMGQYHPAFEADKYPELSRRPSRNELMEARALAKKYGLTRVE